MIKYTHLIMSCLYTSVHDTIIGCNEYLINLALQDFPDASQCASRHLGNVPVHRSQGSDAKEDDCWQFAWQDTSSRAETSFKSLQFSRTSICGSKPSKMDCCAIRRMPCGKSLISTPSYPVPLFFPQSQSLCNKDPLPRFVCKQRTALPGFLGIWTLDENIRNIDWNWEFTDSPDSRWEKGWNLYEWIRMNMNLRLMTLSRPQTWRGLQVGQEPGHRKSQDFECCFQLQTLSALQVTLNLWLWHMMTQYTFVQWNSNKTTFIPMPGCHKCHLKCCPRLFFRMSLFESIFLRKHQIASPNEAERRRHGECVTPRTGYNSHVDIWYCGQLGFMVDVNTHPHCLAKGVLPYSFWLATAATVSSTRADYLSSWSQVMLQLLLPRHWNHGGQCVARHNLRCSKLHAFIPGHRPP